MSTWQNLNLVDKRAILQRIQRSENINSIAVEKDWWVTVVLKALFNTSFSKYLDKIVIGQLLQAIQ
ncbi:MAG: hypothetical protein WCS17_09155 [Prevotella sp.]|jgi:hypothetical protein